MPDYSQQLNQVRAKDKIKKAKIKLPGIIAQRMLRAVDDKEKWVWPFAFMLATFNDLLDIGLIGSIPILGDLSDIFCIVVLTIFLWEIDGLIKWKIRSAIWIAGFIEMIPFLSILIEFLPFWIVSVWYAHYKVSQRADLARVGLKEHKKGKINKGILTEFKQ